MRRRWGRHAVAALSGVAGAAAVVLLAASPAVASPLFCGAGRGLTADVAIQGALDDAAVSASSEGYNGACTLVGDPQIFETFTDPYFGHVYYAQVTVSCEA